MATPQFLAQQQKERDDRLYAEVQALLAVASSAFVSARPTKLVPRPRLRTALRIQHSSEGAADEAVDIGADPHRSPLKKRRLR
jgi:hypothetical protein